MKPSAFEYARPQNVAEAIEALGSTDSSRVLAGGQSLIPAMNFRLAEVSLLVDICDVDGLDTVSCDDAGVRVGARATQTRVLHDARAAQAVPGLRATLRHVGHLQTRNLGTVCGSLAHADPAAELPALAVASDALISIAGPLGRREVAAADFFTGPFSTATENGELVTDALFRLSAPGAVTVVDEVCRRAGDFAIAGLVAVVEVQDRTVRAARLVGFGLRGVPTSLSNAESVLVGWAGDQPTEAIAEAVAADTSEAFDDAHAPGWYRRDAVTALVVRAVRSALGSHEAPEGYGGEQEAARR